MRAVWIMLGILLALLLLGHYHTTAVWEDAVSQAASPSTRPHARIDLYGNPVSNALADYGVDRRGKMYERHAPDTALLELGPPGT